ncbi:VOC family protein [Solicola gregarius]|uniref:Glyoxalase n=1 Tax=Solicola gregarius TaxID=2908642 RepID=A0AA46YNB8_9ACTN|nr:glyoxalase [Solicola gregarius]UYM06568.1 glyoxalase [Solicola gregarius]
MKLHHVQVSCPPGGEGSARKFYAETLGLLEIPKPPLLAARGGAWFADDDFELHVGVEADFAPARKAHPCFAVDDVDAYAARVGAAGYPVEWDDTIPDVRRFHTADGHGNRVEVRAQLTSR